VYEGHLRIMDLKNRPGVYHFTVPISNIQKMYVTFNSTILQIQYLREHFGNVDIEVDGGVNRSTIQQCAEVRLEDFNKWAEIHSIIPSLHTCTSFFDFSDTILMTSRNSTYLLR